MILVVEDEKDSREMLVAILSNLGCQTVGVSSGTAALDILQNDDRFRVVILDVSMAEMDGYTTAEQIRKNEALLPNRRPLEIFFFSAGDPTPVSERIGQRVKIAGYYRKATDLELMIEHLRERNLCKTIQHRSQAI